MSEPVTNVEIEDVLSSIRRLISDEGVAKRSAAGSMTDRFVLTPALRVMEGETAKPGAGGAVPKTEEGAPSDSAKPAAPEEDAEPAIPATDTEWEHVAEGSPGLEAPIRSSRLALEARIAELEAAVSRSREEWEPDGSEPDAEEMPSRHIFAQEGPEDAAVTDPPVRLSAADMVVEESPDLSAPDTGSQVAESKSQVKAESERASDYDIVDEEFLREFIGEIVRRELQGELGERITRNVRRIVRREIQQALALKGIE